MRILISHVYSNNNKGDAALLSVLLSDIKRVFQNPEITILTLDKISEDEKFEGERVINSFMHFARDFGSNAFTKMLSGIFVLLYTFIWAVLYKFLRIDLKLGGRIYETIKSYREADLIVTVGGGYIRAQQGLNGTFILVFILHPILFSSILRKTTVGYSQSIGPFGNKFQEFIAKYTLKKMDAIIVREKISQELLGKWGIVKNVFLSVDSGFLFKTDTTRNIREDFGIDVSKIVVGVTVRNWMETGKQEKYEKDIALLCDYIVEKYKAKIIFIPQVTVVNHNDDDRVCSQKVFSLMKRKDDAIVLNDNYNYKSIKSIYNGLDYLIGTRFHSVIFSLTSKVPSIAIQYEHKTRGIMRELDLEDWVIDIDKTDFNNLKDLFDKIVVNKEEYINKLNKNLLPYIKKAEETIYIVKDISDSKTK